MTWMRRGIGGMPVLTSAALAIFMCLALALAPTPTQAQTAKPLKKVVVAVGTPGLNITYPWVMLPGVLGYWREEGLDVDVIPAGGSSQAIQQVVGGAAQFAEINSSSLVQAVDNNKLPLRAVMLNTVVDWSLVALKDGPVKSLANFKGKAIGISSLGSGGIALVNAYFRASGLNPDKDVEIIPVGTGGMALDALRSGRVAGLMFWGSAIAGFENAGTALTYFRDPQWLSFADFSLTAQDSLIAKDPALVEGFVRGAAKASLFAATNPDCARAVFWKAYPDLKASGPMDEATRIRWDNRTLQSSIDTMTDSLKLGGGTLWGATPASGYGRMQTFMVETKGITRAVPESDLVIANPDFFQRVNAFDHAKIVEAAKACSGT